MESVRNLGQALLVAAATLGLVGCSSGKPKDTCSSGATIECDCPDASKGSAECEPGGTVGACDCALGSGGSEANGDGGGSSGVNGDGASAGSGGSGTDDGATDSSAGGVTSDATSSGGTSGGSAGSAGSAGSGGDSFGGSGGAGDGGSSGSGGSSGTTTASGGASGSGGAGGSGGSGFGPVTPGESNHLPYDIADAEYSPALDAIVLVTHDPDQVVVLDTATLEPEFIELPPLAGIAVSVAPNGLEAAVAQGSWLSIVDLEALSLEAYIDTSTVDDGDVVMAGNGFAYLFPSDGTPVFLHEVEIATETDHGINDVGFQANTIATLHPNGTAMYSVLAGSPRDIEYYDISGGVVDTATDSPYHGDYDIEPGIWISKDGELIFTGAGTVFVAAPGTEDDMTYSGRIEDIYAEEYFETRFVALDHNPVNDRVYAVGKNRLSSDPLPGPRETTLEVYDYESLTYLETLDIPPIETDYGTFPVYGRFVFVSYDGARVYVLAKSPSAQLLDDWSFTVYEVG